MSKYIAIDGMSGTGKTSLANLLAHHLGGLVLHLDDYGNDYEPFAGYNGLDKELSKHNARVIIFEGVGVFHQIFDKYNAFKILINTSESLRVTRLHIRDKPTSIRSALEWNKIAKIWQQAEENYFNSLILNKANLIINNDLDKYDVDNIVNEIKSSANL